MSAVTWHFQYEKLIRSLRKRAEAAQCWRWLSGMACKRGFRWFAFQDESGKLVWGALGANQMLEFFWQESPVIPDLTDETTVRLMLSLVPIGSRAAKALACSKQQPWENPLGLLFLVRALENPDRNPGKSSGNDPDFAQLLYQQTQ